MLFRSKDDAAFIIELLRAGDRPDPDEADELTYAPLLHHLRGKVEEGDLTWILPLIRSFDDERSALYVSMLQRHSGRPEVQVSLKEAWPAASPLVKSHLLWRLTDDRDLAAEWKETLFDFVLSEWAVFQAAALRFYGGKQGEALAAAFERYCGSQFPESKRWAYLCTIADLTKFPSAVVRILELGKEDGDSFTRRVATALIARVTSSKR